jgi:hypothetical protein
MSDVIATEVQGWHGELAALEEQIDALQEQKKAVYERIRRDFDRRTAEGMKVAMRLLRMDERKRVEHLQFSDAGRAYIEMIEGAGSDDWRAQREKDRARPFPTNDNAALDEAVSS